MRRAVNWSRGKSIRVNDRPLALPGDAEPEEPDEPDLDGYSDGALLVNQRGASRRTSVVSRVMGVLGAFSVDSPQLRAAEIARRSGLPSATTHRVLQELVAQGALRREFSGRYTIGYRLWEIGRLGVEPYRLWSYAEPHLESLAHSTSGRAYVTVLLGDDGLRFDGATGPAANAVPCWVVERLPLHATAAGQVLLAFASPEVVERVVRVPLTRYTEHTLVSGEELCRHLEVVRRNATAVSRSQHHPGQVSVAAPIFDHGAVVAAVEAVLRGQADVRGVLTAVTRTAHGLSQDLTDAGRRQRKV
jgi:DNA-binding IclR family transcriptional regulator